MIILSQKAGEIVGTNQNLFIEAIVDTPADLPAQNALDPYIIVCPSTIRCVSGERYMMDSGGNWIQQPEPTTVVLSLADYYTKSESDTRYQRNGTGTTITNTDVDTLDPGRYRNSSTTHGCTNLPSTLLNRPFQIDVEEMATAGRHRQKAYGVQSTTIGMFWMRAQYSSGGVLVWSPWYEYTGTAI